MLLALASSAAAQVEAEQPPPMGATPLPAAQPAPGPQPAPQPVPPPTGMQPQAGAEAGASAQGQIDFGGAEASAGAQAAGDPAGAAAPETREQQKLRVTNTRIGATGGFHMLDAGSGVPGTFRLQLAIEMFAVSDFLISGDANNYAGGTFSFSWTPIDHLELYLGIENHANSNDMDRPTLMQVLGDTIVGIKAYGDATPWLTFGGDVRVMVLNSVGDVGPVLDALSLGLRASASADLRGLDDPFPLILRFNFDYLLDNSSNLIEDLEADRYMRLGDPRADIDSEVRHLLRRVERFALGINRVDMLTIGLGFEAPLQLAPEWYLHPLLEWSFGVPVNRQGYSCLLVDTSAGPADADGCLDIEGSAAMPSTLTLGMRLHPPVRGLSLFAGFDIGVSGTSTFVRELAANRPWAFLIALSYGVDARDRPTVAGPPQVQLVRIPLPPPPPKPRVRGKVVDSMSGAPIPGATVRYSIGRLNPQLTDAAGEFISYELDPGALSLDVSAPDYDPRTCSVDVPAPKGAPGASQPGQEPMPTAVPATPPGNAPVPLDSPRDPNAPADTNPYFAGQSGGSEDGLLVDMRCELTPRPRQGALRGRVTDTEGKPVAGAQATLTGPSTVNLSTDSAGEMGNPAIQSGSYQLRVEADGFLLRQLSVEIKATETTNVDVALVPKPKEAQVELTKEEVRIRQQIFFKLNSAEISEKSNNLLTEIADVLLRNPQVTLIEIQGHTDNTGAPEVNRTLSQLRAEAVRTWLINAGIGSDRLTAIGHGDTRPLGPNLTERARAMNRRVQFIIKAQD